MTYQISPTDPSVTVSPLNGEVTVATILKANGITTSAQLATVIAAITPANNTGMSASTCAVVRALASLFLVVP